jgi:hypothetical protein
VVLPDDADIAKQKALSIPHRRGPAPTGGDAAPRPPSRGTGALSLGWVARPTRAASAGLLPAFWVALPFSAVPPSAPTIVRFNGTAVIKGQIGAHATFQMEGVDRGKRGGSGLC